MALTALADRERGKPRQRARLLVGDARALCAASRWRAFRTSFRPISRCAIPGSSSGGWCRSNGCGSRVRCPSLRKRAAEADDGAVGRAGEGSRARRPECRLKSPGPSRREHWSDELAVPVLVTRCPLSPASTSAGTPPGQASGQTIIETSGPSSAPAAEAEIALVTRTAGMLPPEHPATAPLLLQAAVLEMAHGRAAPAVAALARFDAAGGARDNVLALRERSDAIFTDALAAITDPAVAPAVAMEKSRAAFRLDLPAMVRRSLALLLADRLVDGQAPRRRRGDPGRAAPRRRRRRPLHRLPSGRGARPRRPPRRALRRSARGAAPARSRRRRRRSGAGRHHGHGASHAGGVAGLRRDDGDAGGAGPPARAALPRPGLRRDGAGGRRARLGDGDLRLALRQRHRLRAPAAAPGARVCRRRARRRADRVRADLPAARRSGGARRASVACQGEREPQGERNERRRRPAGATAA